MSLILFSSDGGDLILPDRASLLVSRENGGNLVVDPPRGVWERSELTPVELTQFAFLVSAAGRVAAVPAVCGEGNVGRRIVDRTDALLRAKYGVESGAAP